MTAADGSGVTQASRPGILAPVALAVAGVAAVMSAIAVGVALVGPTAPGSDFAAFWRAGQWLTQGRTGSLYPLASFGGLPPAGSDGVFKGFLNPPHTVALFAPFAALSLRSAFLDFAGLNVVVLVGLAVTGGRALGRAGFASITKTTAILLMIGCPAVAISIVNGTMSLLILAAMIALIVADRDGDAWSTGIPLAIVAWKPQYAVLPGVYLLARRHVRAVAGGAVLTVASMAAALPLTGTSPWQDYAPLLGTLHPEMSKEIDVMAAKHGRARLRGVGAGLDRELGARARVGGWPGRRAGQSVAGQYRPECVVCEPRADSG